MVMVLNGEVLWNKVISGLTGAGEELQTSTGLWFRALAKDGKRMFKGPVKSSPRAETQWFVYP